MLLKAARRSDVDDPEGIGMLVTRLECLLGEASSPEPAATVVLKPPSRAQTQSFEWKRSPAAPSDELAGRLRQIVPSGTAVRWLSHVDSYINSAPVALEALTL
jgi:hypothetical protein